MSDAHSTEAIVNGVPAVYFGGRWHALPRGGDGEEPTPPTRPEDEEAQAQDATPPVEGADEQATEVAENAPPVLPESIEEADEAELRSIHAQLDEFRTAARDEQNVDGVRAALRDQALIVNELNRRIAEAERRAQELEALDNEPVPTLPEASPSLAAADATAAQLATARGSQSAAEQTPPPPAPPRQRVALIAAAGTEVVPAGSEMDWGQLGVAIDRAKRGRNGQTILANIPGFEQEPIPGYMLLSERNGAVVNDELIREATADWAVREFGDDVPPSLARRAGLQDVAAARTGAICEPYDIIRDIPDAFVADTPTQGIFPQRGAGRGGFQFTPSGVLADVAGGVGLWDEDDQAMVDPDDSSTWKECIDYDCPEGETAVLEALYTCVRFDLTLEMSNPERVRNLNNALAALRSRTYEGRLLQIIDSLSHPYVFTGPYGALPAMVEAVNTLVAQLTYVDRQALGQYVLLVPPGVVQILAIDRANKGYNDEQAASNDVMNYLRSNIEGIRSVVNTLDASLGGEPGLPFLPLSLPLGGQAAAGAMPYLSGGVYRLRLVDPSAAIYASTGEINTGVLRDTTMTRMNKTGYFAEEFFFLAKHGPQPWATIDIELCADGARAGLIEPDRCEVS